MKTLLKLSLVAIIMMPCSIIAQDFKCGTNELPEKREEFSSSYSKSMESSNEFRVHFYLLRDNNGDNGIYEELLNNGYVSSEEDFVNQVLAKLNTGFAYSQYPDKEAEEARSGFEYAPDISFISDGWEYLDDTLAVTEDAASLAYLRNLSSSCTAINAYMGSLASTYSGVANYPHNDFLNRGMSINKEVVLSSSVLCHEMGHILHGIHLYAGVARFDPSTGEFYSGSYVYDIEPYEVEYDDCEIVDDHVCDTYPHSIFASDANCQYSTTNNYRKYMPLEVGVDMDIAHPENYNLFPAFWEDPEGNPFEFRQHDNYLGSGTSICSNKFTPGQSQRFSDAIANNLSLRVASCESIEDALLTEITSPSDCYLDDASILITSPSSSATISFLISGVVEQSSSGNLQVDGLSAGVHNFSYESNSCSYDFTVLVPTSDCPSDINNDGLVDIDDFLDFNSAFGTECCPEDINKDGYVDVDDFLMLNTAWETFCTCEEDINEDGYVDIDDFLMLNSAWETYCDCCPGDINWDGFVDIDDFLLLNSDFGMDCIEPPIAPPPSCTQITVSNIDFEPGTNPWAVWNKGSNVYMSKHALSCSTTQHPWMRGPGTLTNYGVDLTDFVTAEIQFCYQNVGWPHGSWDGNDRLMLHGRIGSSGWILIDELIDDGSGTHLTSLSYISGLDLSSGPIDLRFSLNTTGGNTSNKWSHLDDIVISGCELDDKSNQGLSNHEKHSSKLQVPSPDDQITIYPNPAKDEINVLLSSSQKGPVQISAMNQLGQIVLSESMQVNGKGQAILNIDVRSLAKGIYVLSAQGENFSVSSKLVIEN